MPIEPLPTANLQGLRRNSGKKYLTAKPNHITDASRKLDRKSNSLKDYRNFEHFPRTALKHSLQMSQSSNSLTDYRKFGTQAILMKIIDMGF